MLPPVHLYRRASRRSDVLRIIAGNSRTPDKAIGDMHALVAGVNVIAPSRVERAHRPVTALRFVQRIVDGWIDGTERRMRDELPQLPAGHVPRSFTIEGDGVRRRSVRRRVTRRYADDGAIDIDFAGTSRSRAARSTRRSRRPCRA